MSENKSPWGSSGGDKGGKSPWGTGGSGNRPGGSGGGQKPPRRPQQPADLDNVIRGFKEKFGGGGSGGPGGLGGKGSGLPGNLGIGAILVGIIVLFFLSTSLYKIDQNQEGVVLLFGQYSRTTPPGLHLKLPSPFESIQKVNVESERTITIGSNSENLMLTGDENIAKIAYTVIWRVNNSADYVFNLQNVPKAVSDVAESAMREIVGKTELQPLITDQRDAVAVGVQKLMQEMLDEYKAGVSISQVELKESQEPRQVEAAFLEVVAAKQQAEQSILRARETENELIPAANAEADKLIQESKGYKDAVIAESKGDADRFIAIYNQYKTAPRVTRQRMYLETMEKVYANGNKTILDTGVSSGVVPYLPLDKLGSAKKSGDK